MSRIFSGDLNLHDLYLSAMQVWICTPYHKLPERRNYVELFTSGSCSIFNKQVEGGALAYAIFFNTHHMYCSFDRRLWTRSGVCQRFDSRQRIVPPCN